MAKTRAMAMVSAVNKAKTHGAKAKVQNRKTLKLDSVMITVPHRQKQVNPMPQPNRSPSPARSVSEPSGLPSPAEGWHLLKAYMDGEKHASAKVMSDFLEAVSQPELEKAFGEIMGCEDDDEEGQKVLQAMLKTKLAELETQEGPKIPKRKTMFHPKFFKEDSASWHPIRNPTPFSPACSSSPTATPGTARPYCLMGLPSSSIPPTLLCPIPSVSEHSLSTLEKPESLLLEEVDNVFHLDGHEQALPDDQGSVASNKPNDAGHLTAVAKSNRVLEISVAVEERRQTLLNLVKQQRKKASAKMKEQTSKNDDVDESSGQAEEENEEMDKKQGRLSKDVKAQALALHQQYHDNLEALVTKEGKTVGCLLQAVGDVVRDNRALNQWNGFQAFTVHPNGLNMKPKEGQSNKDFQEEIRVLYLEKRNDNDEEEFKGAMEWYKKAMATQTAEKRLEGLSEKELQKLAAPFINGGRQIYEVYQVLLCFGWIVDAVSARAIAFGGDPLYVAMKDANPSQLKSQSVNYGTMIHSQLMLKKQGGVALNLVKQGMVNQYLNEGTDKVVLCGLLKDIWLHSLREVHPNKDYKQMKWGSAFADLCYEAKVKLINYPIGIKVIGPPGGIQGSANMPLKYVKEIIKQYVQFWQQEAREQTAEAAMDQDSQEDSNNEQ
ncbi:hypothetical protein BT96DRAFT_988510 [Gymnopus androsaceus JB14]|uniref:Uncharacterized protein n=1 Tax=Gymnopus androsaceus JB14 TaxID=1447944 RepID=A0A6A4I9V2_9AGAR|nr:hypothetical protein BT96DRAFT_988510 [Gymnopus androsaceus JB14]